MRKFSQAFVLTLAPLAGLGFALLGAPNRSAADPSPTATATAAAALLDAKSIDRAVEKLDKAIDDEGGKLGVSVVSVPHGVALSERNATKPMNPASNAKLPTAAAALSILGAERRFATSLLGEIDHGRVEELVVRGRGDPSLQSSDTFDLVRQLRVAGVAEVGKIVVDQSYFEGSFVPPAFEQQPDEWAAFRAPTSPVSLNRNTVTIWVRPGSEEKASATLFTDPPLFAKIEGTIRTSKKDASEKIGIELSAAGDHLEARASGTVPMGSRPVPVVRRVDDPRALAGYAIRWQLGEQGIKGGDQVVVQASKQSSVLATHLSPPLSELLPRMGKESDNFTAEMLFLAVGAEKQEHADAASATKRVTSFLEERGALDAGSVIKNGSGLFDANRLSPHGITTLLRSVAQDPRCAPEYVSHLAIAGVDGTLRGRMKKWADRRAIRAKTGTLADVVALSGYILDPRGEPAIAFSFLVSGVKGKTQKARDLIDRAVMSIADDLWSSK